MANEIKRVYFGSQSSPVANGNVEAGTYDLTFDSQTTSSLNYNDSDGTIQAALEALSSIGSGNVAVAGTANGYTVEFQGALANTDVGALTAGNITLQQKADTVSVTTTTNGAAGVNEVQQLNLGGATTGTFDVGGVTIDVTSGSLQSDLQSAWATALFGGTWTATDQGGGIWNLTAADFLNWGEPAISNNTTDGSPSISTITNGAAEVFQVVTVTLPDSPTEGTLNVTLDGSMSSDFNYGDNSPPAMTGWTGGGSAGAWTYTRDTAAANVTVSGAEGSTQLRKDCGIEIVATQEGSEGGHSLTANSVSSGTPSVGAPTIGQKHALTANSVSTGTPSVGTPALVHVVALTANGVSSGSPTTGTPTLTHIHVLAATSVAAAAPSVGTPAVGQKHALTATSVSSGAPSVGTPTLSESHILAANSVSSGSPSVGTPTIGQKHALTAVSVASGVPSVGSPSLGQIHALTAANVASGSPSTGAPALAAVSVLAASSVSSGTPSVGSPAIGQIHALGASSVSAGKPGVGSPVFGQLHALVSQAVASGAPSVGSPVLAIVAPPAEAARFYLARLTTSAPHIAALSPSAPIVATLPGGITESPLTPTRPRHAKLTRSTPHV